MRDGITPEEAAEELRLWADYYEVTTRALELLREGVTSAETRAKILAEHAKGAAAIKRIKKIHGIKD